jgi:hypothetical protein
MADPSHATNASPPPPTPDPLNPQRSAPALCRIRPTSDSLGALVWDDERYPPELTQTASSLMHRSEARTSSAISTRHRPGWSRRNRRLPTVRPSNYGRPSR